MSNLGLIMIVLLLILILILLIIVISILNKKKESTEDKKNKNKKSEDIPFPNIEKVNFPPVIEKISSYELHGIVKKIYDSYRYFDYKNMNADNLEKKEWHTWQVSFLLMIFKRGDDFFIPDQKEIFSKSLLEISSNSMNSIMTDILNKYENYVDILSGKDNLSKEYLWSNKEVSIIFYFLTNYKKYK